VEELPFSCSRKRPSSSKVDDGKPVQNDLDFSSITRDAVHSELGAIVISLGYSPLLVSKGAV